jgi:hypothetical protein
MTKKSFLIQSVRSQHTLSAANNVASPSKPHKPARPLQAGHNFSPLGRGGAIK